MRTASQFYASMRRFQQAYDAVLRPLCEQSCMAQGAIDILLFLANNPGLDTARDICTYRAMKPAIVSMHVDHLARDGYLTRCPVSGDRRKYSLRPTALAQPIIAQGQALQARFAAQMTQGVSPEDMENCLRCLHLMEQNIARMASQGQNASAP